MRYWPTILLLVILAGLGGYLYWVELPAKQTEEKQAVAQQALLSFPESEINGLSVTTPQGTVEMKRNDTGRWTITAPLQTEADAREVQAMIRALVTGKIIRTIEEKPGTLTPFGLEQPVTTITVTAGPQQETLAIGDNGPLSSTLYVLRQSSHSVVLTDLTTKNFVNKTLLTFRRKDLLHFVQAELERVRLTYPTTEIVLYNLSKDKPKPNWKIRYPIEAEADHIEVRSLLFKLEDLKALGMVDPGPERDAIAKTLTTPQLKIALHTADGDQTVKLYQPDPDSGEAFAETSPEAPLYRINPMVIKDLARDLFALQDKRLLGVAPDDIAMLSVKTRDKHYVLINENGDWVLEDQPTAKVNQEAANLLVSRVANLPAEERVIKQAGPLAPYGLVAPTAEFVATGRNGKVAGRLTLGNQVNNLVYATGERLQGVFQVRPDLLTQIPAPHELLAAKTETGTSS